MQPKYRQFNIQQEKGIYFTTMYGRLYRARYSTEINSIIFYPMVSLFDELAKMRHIDNWRYQQWKARKEERKQQNKMEAQP